MSSIQNRAHATTRVEESLTQRRKDAKENGEDGEIGAA